MAGIYNRLKAKIMRKKRNKKAHVHFTKEGMKKTKVNAKRSKIDMAAKHSHKHLSAARRRKISKSLIRSFRSGLAKKAEKFKLKHLKKKAGDIISKGASMIGKVIHHKRKSAKE